MTQHLFQQLTIADSYIRLEGIVLDILVKQRPLLTVGNAGEVYAVLI